MDDLLVEVKRIHGGKDSFLTRHYMVAQQSPPCNLSHRVRLDAETKASHGAAHSACFTCRFILFEFTYRALCVYRKSLVTCQPVYKKTTPLQAASHFILDVKIPMTEMDPNDPTIVTDYVHPHSKNAGQPVEKVLPPKVGGEFLVDENVIAGTTKRFLFHLRS